MTDQWTTLLPVLSTAHMPSALALEDLSGYNVAMTETGGFVYVGTDGPGEDAPWLAPVWEWMSNNGFEDGWVRFDSAGDEIDGLPTFDWS